MANRARPASQPHLTDHALRDALRQLVADEQAAQDVLGKILTEIEQTILPRRVRVFTDTTQASEVFSLFVSQRRLVAVRPVHGEGTGDLLARFLAALAGLGSGPVFLHAEPALVVVDSASLTSVHLRTVINASATREVSGLKRFSNVIKPVSQAWMWCDADTGEREQKGHNSELQSLTDIAAILETSRRFGGAMIGSARPECVFLPYSQSRYVVVARAGCDVVLALIETAQRAEIVSSWQGEFDPQ